MKTVFCPALGIPQVKEQFDNLISSVGEKEAYRLWNRYKGEVPSKFYKETFDLVQKNIESTRLEKSKEFSPESMLRVFFPQGTENLDSQSVISNLKSIYKPGSPIYNKLEELSNINFPVVVVPTFYSPEFTGKTRDADMFIRMANTIYISKEKLFANTLKSNVLNFVHELAHGYT